MNPSSPQLAQHASSVTAVENDDDTIDLSMLFDALIENRWLIAAIALVVSLLGGLYAMLAVPIYQANILVQVEDSTSPASALLGEMSDILDVKSLTSAEMEVLRSRFVVSRAVENARLHITVQPKYFPVVGAWMARRTKLLSEPGFFGMDGYVSGGERADVSVFDVPEELEGQGFILKALDGQRYRLTHENAGVDITGKAGESLVQATDYGEIRVHVEKILAKPGAEFFLMRKPMLQAVQQLQQSLSISENGKQSGIINVSLEGTNPARTAAILNELGVEYIRQNVDRKAEEAEKSLAFLDKQLPVLKKNLELAEAGYNNLRNTRGTVDLGEEAKTALQQAVLAETRLVELKQKRAELLTRFQPENSLVVSVNQQIQAVENQMATVNARIRKLPSTEQDVLRLTRDIKVNTDLYTTLLNSAQQLRLIKASKIGNARLLDAAVKPLQPIKPKRGLIVALAAFMGVFLGIGAAFARKMLFGGIDDPHEIETRLGLTVTAAIPHSMDQEKLYNRINNKSKLPSVLAHEVPSDPAVESLRSFRTSIQFSMLDASNNVVMITGPTPGLGKSFVSVNFAALMGTNGKRVLLIDADLRKGYLHRYLGLERGLGLSEVIAGQADVEQALHVGLMENVDFLSTGLLPPRPAELLGHRNFSALLDKIAPQYDLVIIDTAPVLAVSDALVVAPYAGMIFNVVRSDVSTMGEIEQSVKQLKQAGSEVTGIIFNGLVPKMGRYGISSKYGKYRYAQYKY